MTHTTANGAINPVVAGAVGSRLLVDHPGWTTMPDGRVQRGFRTGDTHWAIICDPRDSDREPAVEAARSTDEVVPRLRVDYFDPTTLPAIFRDMPGLRDTGRVHRVRSPHIWEALVPPILRQRIRSADAIKSYRTLCLNHGERLMTAAGLTVILPTPEKILTMSDKEFLGIRLRYKAAHLRALAAACVERADKWAGLSPAELLIALQDIKHVGKWTAGVAIADLTNDFSRYPLAEFDTPSDWERFTAPADRTATGPDFSRVRAELTRDQLSTLTLLYLDWRTRHQPAEDPLTRPVRHGNRTSARLVDRIGRPHR